MLICLLARALTHSLVRGTVNEEMSQNDLVLSLSAQLAFHAGLSLMHVTAVIQAIRRIHAAFHGSRFQALLLLLLLLL